MNDIASRSPYMLHCNSRTTLSNKQPSTLRATGRRGVQFKLEFDLQKLIEPLKVMLPDLFANDLYIADSLTQHTPLLHNDDVISDDVTVGDVPVDVNDVMLNGKGETSVTGDDKHDTDGSNQELTTDNKGTLDDDTKKPLTSNDLPTFSTDLQQNTIVI